MLALYLHVNQTSDYDMMIWCNIIIKTTVQENKSEAPLATYKLGKASGFEKSPQIS